MNRKAVIISNPGESGAENYCRGVLRDVANYRSFLLSPLGGLWRDFEILEMSRPSAAEVRERANGLSGSDYAFVVFAGHGWYSTSLNSTVIELRDGQEIDSAVLRSGASKQTLILDCCRKKSPAIPAVLTDSMRFAKRGPAVNPEECRKYYDKCIADCASGLVVMHACSIGEVAGDDEQKGGYYSHSLLGESGAWVESLTIDTSRQYKSRSVAEAHNAAVPRVQQISGNRQTPSIEKPRTAPYYPFCIVA